LPSTGNTPTIFTPGSIFASVLLGRVRGTRKDQRSRPTLNASNAFSSG
jgi:hypothetical protein